MPAILDRELDVVERNELRQLLDEVTERPDGRPRFPIFSVWVARRTPLYLRYLPVNDLQNGPLARIGDHCRLEDRGQNVLRSEDGRVWEVNPTDAEQAEKHAVGRSRIFMRRNCGEKVILEDVGTYRWMVVKNYDPEQRNDTKHHKFVEGGKLNYDPAERELYQVRGMYTDSEKADGRIGRYDQWRPWAQICLRSCTIVRCVDRAGTAREWHVPSPIIPTADEGE